MAGNLVALLHLCDSLFPLGSFSHSDGLEAAASHGEVLDSATLGGWMDVVLSEQLRRIDGLGVSRSWRAFTGEQWLPIRALDDELYALRPSSAGREASRAMGTRLLKTWQRLRPDGRLDRLVAKGGSATLPVAFGVVAASAGIGERAAVEGFMYTRMAAIVSSAMRLMPIGQHEGHALLAAALDHVPSSVDGVLSDTGPLLSFTPGLDIATMSQQYGHSRLFRS